MIQTDIIIVGAGASGLMAARELAKSGKKVIILEARERVGGRIHTIQEESYLHPAEGGAEFIHGYLPVTLKLLQEAGINLIETGGQSWSSNKDDIKPQNFFIQDWDLLIKQLMKQDKDMSIAQFMEENFAGEKYENLRNSIKGFVEGYDAADTTKASIFALREEWTEADELTQYRMEGGYGRLIAYLQRACIDAGAEIHLLTPVQTIAWEKGRVEIVRGQKIYVADKAIITVPLGVLTAAPKDGGISFIPPIPEKIEAANAIGFGAVIKILAFFKEPFWVNYIASNKKELQMPDLGFLFSDADVPTWWTQHPVKSSLLTGWLAGPRAEKRKNWSDSELENVAIQSLAEIFHLSVEELKNKLITIKVINWTSEIYTRGAYAYSMLETSEARTELTTPNENTLYFAGEALYEGAAMGTVEAALSSGLRTAELISS